MNKSIRKTLNICFAVVAIVSALVTVLLLPPVKGFLKGSGEKEPTESASVIETTAAEESSSAPEASEGDSAEVPEESEAVPQHTNAAMSGRGYTLFIDSRNFDYSENNGVMKIASKSNKSVTMVITPYKNKSFSSLCEEALELHAELPSSEKLDITADNAAFRSQSGDADTDIITTVYCIDDSNGGSVQIVQQIPVNAEGYEESFKLFLSMFKLL